MSLRKRIDLKLGTDLRRRIGEFMICFPFCGAVILALGAFAYHFPIPFLFGAGFISWYWIAVWLSDNN